MQLTTEAMITLIATVFSAIGGSWALYQRYTSRYLRADDCLERAARIRRDHTGDPDRTRLALNLEMQAEMTLRPSRKLIEAWVAVGFLAVELLVFMFLIAQGLLDDSPLLFAVIIVVVGGSFACSLSMLWHERRRVLLHVEARAQGEEYVEPAQTRLQRIRRSFIGF